MATWSYGARTSSPYNGYRPPYKIGKVFTATPSITGRDAPNATGNAAKPFLVKSLTISVNGRSTTTASSRFGLWSSTGTAGAFTDNITLPSGSTNASAVTGAITTGTTIGGTLITGRLCYVGSNYTIGFLKRNTESFIWDIDSSKSGSVIEDNTESGNTTNFVNDANNSSGSLCFTLTYYTLPIAPVLNTISKSADDITISWTAPTDNGGTAVNGYKIQRSLDGTTWSTIVSNTGTTATTYTDYNQAYGSTYYYRVAAINQVAQVAGSAYSGPYSNSKSIALPALAGNTTSTQIVQLTSSDAPLTLFTNTGTGIPFDGVEISYGSEKLYTRVTASSVTSTTPSVVDAFSSQAVYGIRSLDVSGLLNKFDEDVTQVATNLLYEYYTPDLRIESISMNLKVLSDAHIQTLLALELDDALEVDFTPRGIGDPIVSVGRIIGIEHAIDKVSHVITIKMSDAVNNIFTLDSDRQGYLDTNPLG